MNNTMLLDAPATASSSAAGDLLALYEVSPADLACIKRYGQSIATRYDEYIDLFYRWLKTQPEFNLFFSDAHKLGSVQKQQVDYWKRFFAVKVDDEYVENRRMVGEAHARIGLPLPAYFAAVNMSLIIFTEKLHDNSQSSEEHAAMVRAVTKLMHLDTAIIVETFSILTNKKMADQSQALMEMSTPVTAIWDDILVLPIVGIIDSRRAQDVMNAMLTKITETQSRVIILDISGVAVVDTAVANHLIKITKATRLMGCACTISGLAPAIAQTIVELGIDVGEVQTTATLRDALERAFKVTGVDVRKRA